MAKVRELNDGTYGYAAGQGSFKMMVAMLATIEGGDAVLNSNLTVDVINSEAFATAFKTILLRPSQRLCLHPRRWQPDVRLQRQRHGGCSIQRCLECFGHSC